MAKRLEHRFRLGEKSTVIHRAGEQGADLTTELDLPARGQRQLPAHPAWLDNMQRARTDCLKAFPALDLPVPHIQKNRPA